MWTWDGCRWQIVAFVLLICCTPAFSILTSCVEGVSCSSPVTYFNSEETKNCKEVSKELCDEIVYIHCNHGYRKSAFHRFFDCILRVYPAIHHLITSTAMQKCALTNKSVADYIKLFDIENITIFITDEKDSDVPCLEVGEGVRRVYCEYPCVMNHVMEDAITTTAIPWEEQDPGLERLHNHAALRADVWKLFMTEHIAAGDDTPRIVLVDRPHKTRSIQNFKEVVSRFEEHFDENAVTIVDSTDLEAILRAVVKSNVLVHFHGAAGINALFMQDNTLVVEWSTFKDVQMKVPWRTNGFLREVWPNLSWFAYYLPPTDVVGNMTSFEEAKGETDKKLKHYRDVRIDGATILNAVNIIKGHFKTGE